MSLNVPFGRRSDGRAFWVPIFGAPDEGGDGGGEGSGGEGGGSGGAGDGGDDPLASAQRTIQTIRRERNDARAGLRDFKALAAEFGIQDNHLEGLRARLSGSQNGSQQQQPPVDENALRQKVEAEIMAKANARVVRAEIKALATEGFADPDDAVLHLGSQVDDFVKDDGDVDQDAIKSALGDLLKRKKHLAKVTEQPPPGFDGGARDTSGGSEKDFAGFIRGQVAAKRGHR